MTISHMMTHGHGRAVSMSTAERKEKEKTARRAAIVNAAERLFASKGYGGVAMDDVAREAQLAKGTLYLYFDNKDSLYLAVAVRGAVILRDMMARGVAREVRGIDKACATGVAYYEFSKQHPFYFHVLTDAGPAGRPGDSAIRQELAALAADCTKIAADAVRSGVADGTIDPEAEPHKTATFLIESARAMIRTPLLPASPGGIKPAREEVVYFALSRLRHAIEHRPGKPLESIDSGWI
ncbi:MAG: DNA-binding transcriptional repressor FabR [Methanocella sp. PtaU1.Bin125]|nr:MAG: DNA-binding transcriptional repressor FabR [Methanocella sp. PtaU1.Bin125]